MASEAEIIEGCLRGDRHFQKLLYKKFASKMLGVVLRYFRSIEEAEDVLQEGFVKVFTKLSDYRFEGSFEGWVRRIMVNTALNYYRSNLKHYFHTDIDDVEGKVVDAVGTDSSYTQQELLKLVQELPEGYRLVFNLYEIEGYAHKEIAEMLNISINTSKSQLLKARNALQKKLEKLQKEKISKKHDRR